MTLQTDVRTDGRTDVGYHNIPAFSSKSAGIITIIIKKWAATSGNVPAKI